MNRRLLPGMLLSAVILPLATVEACGPDFYPDVFVYTLHPDAPKDFAAGKLGVVLPTYPRADLTVAYRYLAGGTLDKKEQAAYMPTYSMAEPDPAARDWGPTGTQPLLLDPSSVWRRARAAFVSGVPEIGTTRGLKVKQPDGSFFSPYYLNCHDDAFRTAALTLDTRAKAWGTQSAALRDWIAGQDAVFANCRGGDPVLPAAAPAGSPTLLVQDRAYQTAAAHFYAADFDKARAEFASIGHDAASPWHSLGLYLAARCLVRQAFLTPVSDDKNNPSNMALFDAAKMREAQTLLESLRNDSQPGLARTAIEKELDFVRLRTEPMTRLRELARAVAGPKTDPGYNQHLVDFVWLLDGKLDGLTLRTDTSDGTFHASQANNYKPLTQAQKLPEFDATYKNLGELRSTAPLIDWLITYQSPSGLARAHAVAEWKRTGELPWLVAAIGKATGQDAEAPALVAAAAEAQSVSPAWTTLTYHRIRLLIALGRAQEARTALAAALPTIKAAGGASAMNLFSGLRMRAATTLAEALAQAPRTILQRSSQEQFALDECLNVMKNPRRHYDCKEDKSAVALSPDATSWLNRQTPLATLADAAQSTVLPERLRQSVAMMTWTRAVLLKNNVVAARMFPLLPQKLRDEAEPGTGFRPLLALVRNPGLRPYLDPGIQRSYSFDFVESYADNWWCGDWSGAYSQFPSASLLEPIAFLPPDAQKAGAAQVAALLARDDAQADLGTQVVTYVEVHPADTNAAEALYLTLRMIRYGCNRDWGSSMPEPGSSAPAGGYVAVDAGSTPEQKTQAAKIYKVQMKAARLLRQRYASSPWTRKAAPFMGRPA